MSAKEIGIKPLGDRVVLSPVEEDNTTEAGIYIPDTAKEKPQTGIVVAVGDDEEYITVEVGDKVLFPKYTGTEINYGSDEYIIMDFEDLLAVLS